MRGNVNKEWNARKVLEIVHYCHDNFQELGIQKSIDNSIIIHQK